MNCPRCSKAAKESKGSPISPFINMYSCDCGWRAPRCGSSGCDHYLVAEDVGYRESVRYTCPKCSWSGTGRPLSEGFVPGADYQGTPPEVESVFVGALGRPRAPLDRSPSEDGAPERGFLQNLGDVFLAPTEAFKAIAARPRWVAPLLLSAAVMVSLVAVYTAKVDPHALAKAVVEEMPNSADMPAQQRDAILAWQAAALKPIMWGSVLGAGLWPLILGAYFLYAFRFFYGSDAMTFKQSFTIATFASLAVSLVQTPLMLVTLALKGDWNIPLQFAFQASPALFLDRMETAKWLYALASSFDLVTLWFLALLSIGYGVATRRSVGSAAWAAVIPWFIIVLIKVGFAALSS